MIFPCPCLEWVRCVELGGKRGDPLEFVLSLDSLSSVDCEQVEHEYGSDIRSGIHWLQLQSKDTLKSHAVQTWR